MRGDVPAGLWLGTAIVALAASVGLARSRTEEAAVAIIGLVVFSLVVVSVASRMMPRGSSAVGRARSLDVPVLLLLFAAFVAFCASVVLWFFFEKNHGIFVGLWVPSILSLAAVMLLIRRATG